MKTTTYLRLSLLIPFVVWGVCLLIFAVTNLAPETTNGPMLNFFLVLFVFYVFGILGWFLPYVLLSLILLIWSFKGQAQTLVKMFALSPFAMTVIIMIFVSIVLGSGQDPATLSPDLAANADFLGSPVWFGIVTLLWGYICVAIGWSVYLLLQRLHIIRDTENWVTPAVTGTA
jgi:hypothetical protein